MTKTTIDLPFSPEDIRNGTAKIRSYIDDLEDLARNCAAINDSLLKSADLNVIRQALREFQTDARNALASKPERLL